MRTVANGAPPAGAPRRCCIVFTHPTERAISSGGERFVHTEEVTGSIPVSPTACFRWSGSLSMIFIGGLLLILGSKRGARPADHSRVSEEVTPSSPTADALRRQFIWRHPAASGKVSTVTGVKLERFSPNQGSHRPVVGRGDGSRRPWAAGQVCTSRWRGHDRV